jgi:hypothetical protein
MLTQHGSQSTRNSMPGKYMQKNEWWGSQGDSRILLLPAGSGLSLVPNLKAGMALKVSSLFFPRLALS